MLGDIILDSRATSPGIRTRVCTLGNLRLPGSIARWGGYFTIPKAIVRIGCFLAATIQASAATCFVHSPTGYWDIPNRRWRVLGKDWRWRSGLPTR